MVARGSDAVPYDGNKWPLVDEFPVLGHSLQPCGSIRSCWTKAKGAMWKSFWANPGTKAASHLSQAARLALLRRSVLPQLTFRCSRWPPQRRISQELDAMQQKMVASALKLSPATGEAADSFVRRRGRAARSYCHDAGRWSYHWFERAVRWDDHLS